MTYYLNALGIVNPLGVGKDKVAANLFLGNQEGLIANSDFIKGQTVYVGQVQCDLPLIPEKLSVHNSRNNQLALLALSEIEEELAETIKMVGKDRIGVVVGTSTSGIGTNESGIAYKVVNGEFPPEYHYQRQTPSDLSSFIQEYLDVKGPAMTVSTACTSGAKAVASGVRLLKNDICDAVIVGGVDSLCGLTLNGFKSLESLSAGKCLPFSANRDGINIGEGAAIFILSRRPGPVEVCGFGETSDAYHISAPSPDGKGAIKAMEMALGEYSAQDIAYVNLHGTATALNDAMEAKAVHHINPDVPCSSTKSMTGHMLGAAGSNELGFLYLSILHAKLPPHVWDGEIDEEIAPLNFVTTGQKLEGEILLSNSFAFGGNNICIAVKKGGG